MGSAQGETAPERTVDATTAGTTWCQPLCVCSYWYSFIYLPVPPGFALRGAFVSSPAWDGILHHIRD
jgi:hypothetical protein